MSAHIVALLVVIAIHLVNGLLSYRWATSSLKMASIDGELPLSMTPPKRILLVVEPTPFNYISGYANRFKEMLTYLNEAGDHVAIVTTDPSSSAPKQFLDYQVHNFPGVSFPWYQGLHVSFDTRGTLRSIIRNFQPDLIHISSPSALLIGASFWAKWFNIPLVLSYHTDLVQYTQSYWPKLGGGRAAAALVRHFHRSADLTLCTSPQLRDQMLALGIAKSVVWRKGINTDTFSPSFRNMEMRWRLSGGHPQSPLLLYVGRLGVEKRLHRLRPVLLANPTARLAIVGAGPAESTLRNELAGLPVEFVGAMTGEALSQAFASADIFVMPSDTETLGFVVLEAMASGLPVVGAQAGGLLDIIRDGVTGFLAPSNDHDMSAFSTCVSNLITDTALREEMGQRALAATKMWSWRSATSVLRNEQYPLAMALHRCRHDQAQVDRLMHRYNTDHSDEYSV